jgi:hypothetical protein
LACTRGTPHFDQPLNVSIRPEKPYGLHSPTRPRLYGTDVQGRRFVLPHQRPDSYTGYSRLLASGWKRHLTPNHPYQNLSPDLYPGSISHLSYSNGILACVYEISETGGSWLVVPGQTQRQLTQALPLPNLARPDRERCSYCHSQHVNSTPLMTMSCTTSQLLEWKDLCQACNHLTTRGEAD